MFIYYLLKTIKLRKRLLEKYVPYFSYIHYQRHFEICIAKMYLHFFSPLQCMFDFGKACASVI